jgi:hypothetical protein
MQFGLFYEWPNPTLRNWKTLFEEGMEQIQYSEALGFDYCLIAEHHFSNYGNSPAPLICRRDRRSHISEALALWQSSDSHQKIPTCCQCWGNARE